MKFVPYHLRLTMAFADLPGGRKIATGTVQDGPLGLK